MAKKNSSKTATEKAIQAAEPRVMSYGDWKGVSFVDSPLGWEPLETGRYDHRQTKLPKNFLMVQNNVVTTDTLALETRPDSNIIFQAPAGVQFTGVTHMFHKWLFAVGRKYEGEDFTERIYFRDLTDDTQLVADDNSAHRRVVDLYFYGNKTGGDASFPTAPGSEGAIPKNWVIYEIGTYENNLIATASSQRTHETSEADLVKDGMLAAVFLANLNYNRAAQTINIQRINYDSVSSDDRFINDQVTSVPFVNNPETKTSSGQITFDARADLSAIGMASGNTVYAGETTEGGDVQNAHTVKVEVTYAFTTRMGSTLVAPTSSPFFTEYPPTLWSSARYVNVGIRIPTQQSDNYGLKGITGIDVYGRDTENTNWVFIGHVAIADAPKYRWGLLPKKQETDPDTYGWIQDNTNGTHWVYPWLGNMTDISQWTSSQLNAPTSNDTSGPAVRHFSVHDSKLYYWGEPLFPYRLYIGGNPGSEFSVARGLGGAWIDIEPGSGYDIMGTAKWKTVAGANIITIMCGNANTDKVKRFNLVETNVTITNEISYKGYMYEEVSNVVGCNSRYGYGVFADGLYSISRYGLYLTTMAMEYNSQMRNQSVSEVIKPIFSERLGNRLKDARMVYIDQVVYIVLSAEGDDGDGVTNLDNVILCYDTQEQAWYTFTHDETVDQGYQEDPDSIHHIFSVDSDQAQEGLGVVTDSYVYLYPTTLAQEPTVPIFDVLLETGELMPKEPMQALMYVQQLEFRFDYLVCDPGFPPTILVEGTDYYGRSFKIEKQLNVTGGRGNHGRLEEMRDYVEWIRVDKYVDSYRIRIKGKVRFKLTHFNVKFYAQPDNIGTQWGFDARDRHLDAHGTPWQIHHYIKDYNNLRRVLVS